MDSLRNAISFNYAYLLEVEELATDQDLAYTDVLDIGKGVCRIAKRMLSEAVDLDKSSRVKARMICKKFSTLKKRAFTLLLHDVKSQDVRVSDSAKRALICFLDNQLSYLSENWNYRSVFIANSLLSARCMLSASSSLFNDAYKTAFTDLVLKHTSSSKR